MTRDDEPRTSNDKRHRDKTMTKAQDYNMRVNRLGRICAAGFTGPYEIDFSSCPGFWFLRIDGRSYPIGHDGTTDADMARKATAWVEKVAS